MKKKNCIKHKLWGRLKRKAYDFYRIKPFERGDWYQIWRKRYPGENYFASDEFDFILLEGALEFDEAVEKIEMHRQTKFWELCNEALYQRRLEKCKNL